LKLLIFIYSQGRGLEIKHKPDDGDSLGIHVSSFAPSINGSGKKIKFPLSLALGERGDKSGTPFMLPLLIDCTGQRPVLPNPG
jgi:hypothetical protein